MKTCKACAGPSLSDPSGARTVTLEEASNPSNPRVFLDIEIGGSAAGRVEFELFSNIVPWTAENFRALTTGERGQSGYGTRLHYKGIKFHRIIGGFMGQGGDIGGAESIYGGTFNDEWGNGVIKHTGPMLLSMANSGKNSNSAQFVITFARLPHLDRKHVVFGRVTKGEDVVRKMEAAGTPGGTPSQTVIISNSGELK